MSRETLQVAVGEPIDPADLEPMTPEEFMRGRRVVSVVERTLAELRQLRDDVARVVNAPEVMRTPDGRISVRWPDGARYCLMSRELLEEIVDQLNGRQQP